MIRYFHLKYGFSILALLETKISGEQADNVLRRICFNGCYKVQANGFAKGIWVLWDASIWDVTVLSSESQYIHMYVSSHGGTCYLTSCYGHLKASLRSALWEGLQSIASLVKGP